MNLLNNDSYYEKYYGNNLNDPFRTNTRFNYDPCRTIKNLQQSTGLGRYMLNVPGVGDKPLIFNDPYIIGQKWTGALLNNSIDIQNSLLNIDRPLSKDLPLPDNTYTKPTISKISYPLYNKPFTEQTRATLPAWCFREVSYFRSSFPLYNPQQNISVPFYNNSNTRILAKDYFNRFDCIENR